MPNGQNEDSKVIEGEVVESSGAKKQESENDKKDAGSGASVESVSSKVSADAFQEIEDDNAIINFDKDESFWEILEQAGFSWQRILKYLVFTVLIVVGALYLFFWRNTDKSVDVPKENVVENSVTTEIVSLDLSDTFFSSYYLGIIDAVARFGFKIEGIEWIALAPQVLGFKFDQVFLDMAYYVEILKKMTNLYEVDIYTYLDRSSNRAERIDNLIADYKILLTEAERVYAEINRKMDIYEPRYKEVVTIQNSYETAYFSSIDNLEGQKAYDNLLLFIDSGKESFEIKSIYNSLKLISGMYLNSLDALWRRYDDIVANREALIKGIRVFDIPGSDINAIIPLE